jgi:leucyl aminopeptidase
MPFHKDFIAYMKKVEVADLKNTDYTGKGGSITAAMFLKEFSEGKPFVHLDIAGTAMVVEDAKAPLVRTLSKLVK